MSEKNHIEIERLLGSKGRIRVLQILAESEELNITEVTRRTGLNYMGVQRHLEELRDMAYAQTGEPPELELEDELVALVEYRDGTILDAVWKPRL